MKFLKIKLYGTHYKETLHKALTMWFVDDSVFFAHLNRTDSIGRFRRPSSSVVHTLYTSFQKAIEAKDHKKPSQDGET